MLRRSAGAFSPGASHSYLSRLSGYDGVKSIVLSCDTTQIAFEIALILNSQQGDVESKAPCISVSKR